MVFASIREHASTEIFWQAQAEIKNLLFKQRALLIFLTCSNPYGNPFLENKAENILKRGFNLEHTKFFEASLSDTLSRSNRLQSHLVPNDVTFLAIKGGGRPTKCCSFQ